MRTVAIAMVLILASPATALTLTTYTDRAAWEAAAGSVVTEDFQSAPIGEVPVSGGTIPLGHFTLDIDANHGGIGIFEDETGDRFFRGDVHSEPSDPPEYNRVLLNEPTKAFGLDLLQIEDLGDYGFYLKLEALDFAEWPSTFELGFLGFVADELVSVVYFAEDYQFFAIDNVSLAPVPEPSTGLLMMAGLVGIASARRRSR